MPKRSLCPVFGGFLVALLVVTGVLGGVAGARPSGQPAGPELVLDAVAALPGDRVTARGTEFSGENAFELVLLPAGDRLARGRTDERGGFQERFVVPRVAPGDYIVRANVQGETAQAPLRVLTSAPPTQTPIPPPPDPPVPSADTQDLPTSTSIPTATPTGSPTRTPSPEATSTSTPLPPTATTMPSGTPRSTGTSTVTAKGASCVPTSRSFVAVADAYVNQASPTTNSGTGYELRAKLSASAQLESYVRFDLAGLSGPVTQAILQLTTANYQGAATTSAPDVRSITGTWEEGTVTWDTRPTYGADVATGGGVWPLSTSYTWDVTSAVAGNGPVALALIPNSRDGVNPNSREQTTGKPTLTVTFGCPGSGSSPTNTPIAPSDTPVPTSTASPTDVPTDTMVPSPSPTHTATPVVQSPTSTPTSVGSAVLLAAGDIAGCSSSGDEATAKLLDALGGTVATLGDNVYDSGTASEFSSCYAPNWGRHKARTYPAPGNHDYQTAGASGYYGYFGDAATPLEPGCRSGCKGYYSYDLGAWHVIVINSNVDMTAGSAQLQWLRADLAAHPTTCTLAYWHHPRFSSGSTHGSSTASQPIWQVLYDAGADLVLVGHDHTYERFAPQDAAGRADSQRGIREFVVGTGGRGHYSFGTIQPNSEVRNGDTFGVLKLTLTATGYSWEFVPEAGKTFSDSGNGSCH